MRIEPGDLIGVTGANGQVGRAFCEEAIAQGYRVRALGRSFGRLPPDIEHVALDLGNMDGFHASALEGCAALVHSAAFIPSDHRSFEQAEQCWRVNVMGTARLIQAMASAGVGRLVQMSSASAYGAVGARSDEHAPLYPASRTFYLSSKIAQELVALERCREAGISLADLRISSVYGSDPQSSLLTRFAVSLAAGEAVQLSGNGGFGADFVLVDDVARATLVVLESGRTGVLNVASGARTTIAEAAAMIARLVGASPQLVRLQEGETSDPGFPAIDVRRLAEVGLVPTGLDEGLRLVVQRLSSDLRGSAEAGTDSSLES